ncbi:MAG: T9SS type A sorting domain-containing protein [Bacteroidota bacterium]
MKKILFTCILSLSSSIVLFAQTPASDFTVTTTDGTQLKLYQTLNTNKTIMLDFFFTTCGYCIQYAPIIDAAYVDHGSGAQNFDIWGIDNGNNNADVVAYKTAHTVTNPCASGTEGGADAVTTTYSSGTYGTFTGWPTYSLICPDKHVFWDVNYPPSQTGFDTYLTQCSTDHSVNTAVNSPKDIYSKVYSAYPNPATDLTTVSFGLGDASNVQFEIYNLLGEKLETINAGTLGSGYHQYEIAVDQLTNGNYLIKMIAGNYQVDRLQLSVIH